MHIYIEYKVTKLIIYFVLKSVDKKHVMNILNYTSPSRLFFYIKGKNIQQYSFARSVHQD